MRYAGSQLHNRAAFRNRLRQCTAIHWLLNKSRCSPVFFLALSISYHRLDTASSSGDGWIIAACLGNCTEFCCEVRPTGLSMTQHLPPMLQMIAAPIKRFELRPTERIFPVRIKQVGTGKSSLSA